MVDLQCTCRSLLIFGQDFQLDSIQISKNRYIWLMIREELIKVWKRSVHKNRCKQEGICGYWRRLATQNTLVCISCVSNSQVSTWYHFRYGTKMSLYPVVFIHLLNIDPELLDKLYIGVSLFRSEDYLVEWGTNMIFICSFTSLYKNSFMLIHESWEPCFRIWKIPCFSLVVSNNNQRLERSSLAHRHFIQNSKSMLYRC